MNSSSKSISSSVISVNSCSKLEELQEESLLKLLEEEQEPVKVITPEEETAALELLHDPNLIQRIIKDVRKCGLVGEDTNALVAYLAATSRKTDDPLAVIIQSSSSAGKSSVMKRHSRHDA